MMGHPVVSSTRFGLSEGVWIRLLCEAHSYLLFAFQSSINFERTRWEVLRVLLSFIFSGFPALSSFFLSVSLRCLHVKARIWHGLSRRWISGIISKSIFVLGGCSGC
ncbi:hypothetical protein CSUI_010840 [Cystoisospora suis]|uniref:Transmembrane protein n=1 Tax=Cystoisospora suis TaxID=483139 RepID=A0A2C6KFA8_9APIC|nr:hypothetical protein CSUI_010840 [Cystoisospora suis]